MINDAAETDCRRRGRGGRVGANAVESDGDSVWRSEDFAFMLAGEAGGLSVHRQGPRRAVPVHNPQYDFNDEILPIGASCGHGWWRPG